MNGPELVKNGFWDAAAIGFSFGSLVDPVNGTQSTILSQAYSMMGLLMFGWSVGILVTTVIRYEKVSIGFDPANDSPAGPDLD